MSTIRDGQRWGDWQFVAENLTLVFQREGLPKYEIDLEGVRDSGEALDWLFHMREKSRWVTDEVIGTLIDAFKDLLWPFDSPGTTGEFDPRKHILRLMGRTETP
jgi:hypothetical protein